MTSMRRRNAIIVLTLLLSGRAMTLAFLGRVGGGAPDDPPAAWLMPLLGDALIGVSALGVAYLVARRTGLWVWGAVLVWNALGIWDALAAFVVHVTTPWPSFFMIRAIGAPMFFGAAAMHLVAIVILSHPHERDRILGAGGKQD